MGKKLLYALGSLVLLIVIVCVAGYIYLAWLPLPETEGEIRLAALHKPVKVYRDSWGVPHIYAENEHDLFVAQGFVQAQDRLWQMETNRRLAAGRLSEVVGPKALELDKTLRTLGLMRAAEEEIASYNDADKEIFSAFAEGVNACIQGMGNHLPVEFKLLETRPEPWRAVDSIGWAKVIALLGSKNWQEEITRTLLAEKLGPEKAEDLLGRLHWGTPVILPHPANLSRLFSPPDRSRDVSFLLPSGASNNWTVHGSRTNTGYPLLANDMHLAVGVPSVWYEMHLVGGRFDVTGLSFPGVPLIIAGHNQHVAWGITFAYVDTQDLFLEKMNPENEGEYLYKGQWLQVEEIQETIRVKGQEQPVTHKVWRTRHGPIVSTQLPDAVRLHEAVALKWEGHDPGDTGRMLRDINLAQHWDQFKAAASKWSGAPINLVYADRDGNIGYVLGSRIPIRPRGHGSGPFPGWTGDHDWLGYVDPGRKPFLFNPAKGFIATANNQTVSPEFPYYIGQDYAPGYRAARIEEVLSENEKASESQMGELQGDLMCLPGIRFIESIKDIIVKGDEASRLLELLRAWDHILSPDSTGGAVYSVLFYRMLENTFRDELDEITDMFLGIGSTPLLNLTRFTGHCRVILLDLLSDPRSIWFDDIHTPQREDLSAVLEKSLEETAAFLTLTFGPETTAWKWGKLHEITMIHSLGRAKPLDRIFNLGPFPVGGDFTTVWQSTMRPGMDFRQFGWTTSNRHIYDLKDWDQSVGAIVPGQSGMFGSPHYDDQVDLWLRVQHHPLYYSQSKVESEAANILTLSP